MATDLQQILTTIDERLAVLDAERSELVTARDALVRAFGGGAASGGGVRATPFARALTRAHRRPTPRRPRQGAKRALPTRGRASSTC
jgi:hypothetical protein